MLTRTIERWKALNPEAMYQSGSPAALFYALQDARRDLLALADLLCLAAYPRRGTAEESMSIQDFAEIVQSAIPLHTLA